MVDWFCHEPLHQSRLAINTRSSVDIFGIVISRILLARSRLVSIRAKFVVLNVSSPTGFIWLSSSDCSRSAFRIVSISIGLYIFHNVAFRSFMSNNIVCTSRSIQFLPNFRCVFSTASLQVNKNNPYPPHVFTRFRSHLWILHLNVHEFHPRRFSPRWMYSWMSMQIVTGCKVLSPVTLHHLMKTFTQ